MSGRIEPLLKMLESGHESALLRFSLASEYVARDDFVNAAIHLSRCLELDRGYSAAWKLLGTTLIRLDRLDEAAEVWSEGIEVAGSKGDRQAAKEMTVFLRRLQKRRTGDSPTRAREED